MLWLSGPVCILLLLCLPETSSANILYRRAQRLRRVSGNQNLRSQSEIDQKNLTAGQGAYDALIKPTEINFLDPAVLFTTVYTGLIYGSFYSFFQSFPLVYPVIYHFRFATSSLPFFAVLVGLVLAASAYCAYWHYYINKQVQKEGPSGLGSPEMRLIPGLFACVFFPTGLFVFGTSPSPPSSLPLISLIPLPTHSMDSQPLDPLDRDSNRALPNPDRHVSSCNAC